MTVIRVLIVVITKADYIELDSNSDKSRIHREMHIHYIMFSFLYQIVI